MPRDHRFRQSDHSWSATGDVLLGTEKGGNEDCRVNVECRMPPVGSAKEYSFDLSDA